MRKTVLVIFASALCTMLLATISAGATMLVVREASFMDMGRNPPIYEAGNIVDLTSEGISLPFAGHSGQALKIAVGMGETREFRVYNPYLISEWDATWEAMIYLTGDAQVACAGGYAQANSISRLRGQWHKLFQTADNDLCFKVSAVNGGALYIATLELFKWDNYARFFSTYPKDIIATQNSYSFRLPLKQLFMKVTAYLKPETTMTVNLQWRGQTAWETLATGQATTASPNVSMLVKTPDPDMPNSLTNEFRLNVVGNGTLEYFSVDIANK